MPPLADAGSFALPLGNDSLRYSPSSLSIDERAGPRPRDGLAPAAGGLAGHISAESFLAGVTSMSTVSSSLQEHVPRGWFERMIQSQVFETMIGVVIICNFVVISMEADATVSSEHVGEDTPAWIALANLVFLVIYCLEITARLFIERLHFFKNPWNRFDSLVVVLGICGQILGTMSVGFLRAFRTFRLLRAIRLLISFKELWLLVSGLLCTVKTLLWATILMFVLLTIWSIVAVENIHPLMQNLEEQGLFGSCGWCGHAFSSVMISNLTFFQVVTGDGWSTIARPIIQEEPWTAILFIALIMTMMLGIMNLVTAVIVEQAAEARDADLKNQLKESELKQKLACKDLMNICKKIDLDNNGEISISELTSGITTTPELRSTLNLLDVHAEDLEDLFKTLDTDSSGEVSYGEFATQIWRMKTQGWKSSLMFMKQSVARCTEELKELRKFSADVTSRMDTMQRTLAESCAGVKSLRGAGAQDYVNAATRCSASSCVGMASTDSIASTVEPTTHSPSLGTQRARVGTETAGAEAPEMSRSITAVAHESSSPPPPSGPADGEPTPALERCFAEEQRTEAPLAGAPVRAANGSFAARRLRAPPPPTVPPNPGRQGSVDWLGHVPHAADHGGPAGSAPRPADSLLSSQVHSSWSNAIVKAAAEVGRATLEPRGTGQGCIDAAKITELSLSQVQALLREMSYASHALLPLVEALRSILVEGRGWHHGEPGGCVA